MTKATDDLADALFESVKLPYEFTFAQMDREELRTLAREAAELGAKQALLDAAEAAYRDKKNIGGGLIRVTFMNWLRARAKQIGKPAEN